MKKAKYIFFLLSLIFTACNTTKNIPEGAYLLDKIQVKHDTKNATSDLEAFVRQQPNSSFPLLGKFRLKLYNIAGEDTSKWTNRLIRKLGEPPVLYNASQAIISQNQLQKQLTNQGYLNALADTTLKIKGKKISVTYNLKGGDPYLIRNYTYQIKDTTIARIMGIVMSRVPLKRILNKGDMYDMDMLEEERLRVNTIMRNVGYYDFSKEYVYFRADTTLNSHEVDLYMDIYPAKDSLPYLRYKLDKITVISGLRSTDNLIDIKNGQINTNRWFFKNADTTDYKDIRIIRGRNKFLRTSAIYRNNSLHKGAYYSDMNLTRTYEGYNKMGAIKQVNITNTPSPKDSTRLLDATIVLLPANAHWFKAGLDGTNSAGDIGIAPSVSYQHQNLFNGGEILAIKLKGAYEFIAGGKNTDLMNNSYYEYGVDANLSYPLFLFPWMKKSWREQPSAMTQFSIGLNNQHRKEYTRQFFNMGVAYGWTTFKNKLTHNFDLLDVNYIRMPWVSPDFENTYLTNESNTLLSQSYKDQLVARTAYAISLSNGRRFNPLFPTFTLRSSLEVAGVLPRLAASIGGANLDKSGQKTVLGVAYAEYVKSNIDYARTFYFSKKHSLAYHVAFGIAYPYGNSKVLPFERRFFSGGANSVRGWSTRSLGPGSYKNVDGESNFVNQTGDIKFDASIENRLKVSEYFELAQFVDVGNIWTIKSYDQQEGGRFKFNSFYKELAIAYGLGIRFDLGFLLLRFDMGMKAYDPGQDQSERFILLKPRFSQLAFHFGIGYPF